MKLIRSVNLVAIDHTEIRLTLMRNRIWVFFFFFFGWLDSFGLINSSLSHLFKILSCYFILFFWFHFFPSKSDNVKMNTVRN